MLYTLDVTQVRRAHTRTYICDGESVVDATAKCNSGNYPHCQLKLNFHYNIIRGRVVATETNTTVLATLAAPSHAKLLM